MIVYCRGTRIIFLSSRHILSNISKPQYYCNPLFYFFFSILSPNYAFSHKFPLKLLANGVICNTWYSSCSKPPPVYPGILLAPPAAKSCLQDTTRSAKSQPDSLHRPVFCKILLQGFAPPTIMYLYIISKGAWHSRFPGLPGALDSKQKGGRPMPRIAVVDDQPDMRQQLCSMIDQYSRENNCMLEVTTFSDGAQVITNYCKGFDIIFLDIEMPELGGMDAAERIRTVDPDVVLVFVTNMAQYAIRGYEVDALDFVLKPVNYYQFSTKLARALQRVQRRKGGQIALQTAGGVQLLNTEDIYWLETRDRMLHYHTSTGVWSVRSSLQNAEKQLAPYHFAKCNQCYLVNLRYVRAVQNDMVQVGEDRLEISRRQRAAFLAAVAAYVGGAM